VNLQSAVPVIDVSEYCRDIETHLCRKNDGHLMRIVGPSFEIVSRWAASGVPLKVAMSGIDRYFERYYRKGPRRRPVKIDFCEADVLDVFDEWRRATGITTSETLAGVTGDRTEAAPPKRRGPSLPEHLERVLVRLSSLRATGQLGDAADPLVDAVSTELDVARGKSGGLRGDERRVIVDRLAALDAQLVALVRSSIASDVLDRIEREAEADLVVFRATMAPDAFAAARERAATRLLREQIGLPVIAFA
jgi:hypothetical protein